jgi:2-polyprenyl-6-methoxyphenol hydroxylase-like FAD-dependent oxidoreductase
LTRFNFDALLITAFMDRWRLETHTFHFPVGEMTLSLEDAAMLGGLSCASEAMGPIDIPATWQAYFLARFANVPRNDRVSAPYLPFVYTHGPTWTWIQQFCVRDSNSYFQSLYAFK